MNKQVYLIILGFLFVFPAYAQVNQGARLAAMGNNGTAVEDISGVSSNPATITRISSPRLQLTHQHHFFSKEIKNQALAVVLPSKTLGLGLSLQHYGITTFQNNKVGIVIVKPFGANLAIGLRGNYHQLKISHYGTTSGISVDLGTIYKLTDHLSLGFYMNNLSKERYATKTVYTSLPTTAYFGIAYQASDKLLMASTLSTDNLSTGIDYQILNRFSIRSGISLRPFTYHFGIGFTTLKFVIDFAFIKQVLFGYSPILTIGYGF